VVSVLYLSLFYEHTAHSELYALSLHDALPISSLRGRRGDALQDRPGVPGGDGAGAAGEKRLSPTESARIPGPAGPGSARGRSARSEEHTSELQSREKLVCRLLLEKKKNNFIRK